MLTSLRDDLEDRYIGQLMYQLDNTEYQDECVARACYTGFLKAPIKGGNAERCERVIRRALVNEARGALC